MKYKNYFLVFILTFIPSIYSQDCTIADDEGNTISPYIVFAIKDVDYNNGFSRSFEFKSGTPTKITPSEKAALIIDVELIENNTLLVLTSKSNIPDIDKVLDRSAAAEYDEYLIVAVEGCSIKLSFEFKIADTNNHNPSFKDSKLTVKVPNPLVPGVPLSFYLESAILATDLDYTNANITFTIEPSSSDYNISFEEISPDSKDFEAVIKPKNYIWLQKTTTLMINATDAFGLSSENLLEIDFQIDEDNVLPDIPDFKQPFYSFTYNEDDLQITGNQIEVTTKVNAELTISIKEDSDEIFKLSYDTANSTVFISLNKPIPNPENKDLITFTLTATKSKNESASTAILITMPKDDATPSLVPTFSSVGYKATYEHFDDKDDILTIDSMKPVEITNDQKDDIKVTVGSEYCTEVVKRNFIAPYVLFGKLNAANMTAKINSNTIKLLFAAGYFTPVSESDVWTFTVSQKLDENTLNTVHQIIVNLEANLDGSPYTGHAIVVVDLPLDVTTIRATPLFTQPFYKSHIDEEKKLVMDDKNIAIFDGPYEDVTEVTVENKYASNFKLSHDSANKEWIITLGEPLQDETENQIAVQLNAHLDQALQDGAATLLVRLKEDDNDAKVGKFDSSFYICTYTVASTGIDTVSCETDITVSDIADSTIGISDSDQYKDFFNLRKKGTDETIYSFEVARNLSPETLQAQADVLVVIELVKDNDKSTATVVVNLPLKDDLKPLLKFESNAYTASYSTSGSVQLIDGPITLSDVTASDNPQVSIKSDDEYRNNFKIALAEGSSLSWTLAVNTPLGQDVLDEKISITVTVEATVPNRISPASTAVVVNLPKKMAEYSFSFDADYYTADYENNVVTFNQKITLEGDTEGVVISLQGDFANYFEQERDGNEIKIELDQDLPKEALERPSITISIRAAKGDTEVLVVPFVINNQAAINGGGGDGSSGKGPNDTTFIIVIAMLAVLLVVGIVGSAIFYYRRRNKMAVVEEPETTPRFTKNSSMSDSKKVSEPSIRRPTGLHILSQQTIESDDLSNINEKDFDAGDRRKSVIFDEVVEEMEIDPNEEDQKDEQEDTHSNSSASSNEEEEEEDEKDDEENSTKL